jgi:PTH1 family peptidyl-tRNA hydrolase
VKIVIGIGNPGRDYEATRHNVGFRVLDRVARALGTDIRRRKFRGRVGDAMYGGAGGERERVILAKPETYVNLSGECARQVVDFYGAPIESLLVVLDDVNLPLGQLRCRRGGSSGGHKGMKSLIRHLGTEDFARLRVGVGRPGQRATEVTESTEAGGSVNSVSSVISVASRSREAEGGLVGHVLGDFSREEASTAEAAEDRAAQAVLDWILNGVEHCMNTFNCSAEERKEPRINTDEHG